MATFLTTATEKVVGNLRDMLAGDAAGIEGLGVVWQQYQREVLGNASATAPAYTFSEAEEDKITAYPFVRLWIDGAQPVAGNPGRYEYTALIEVIERAVTNPSSPETALEQLTRRVEAHAEPLRAVLAQGVAYNGFRSLEVGDIEFTATAAVDSSLYRSVIFTLDIEA